MPKLDLGARISAIKKSWSGIQTVLSFYRKQIKLKRSEKKSLLADLQECINVLKFIQRVGIKTHKQTTTLIESMVTFAIRDVFGDDGYDFEIELEQKGKTNALNFYFCRDGEKFDPMECCGYGIVDVACFALRIAIWRLGFGRRVFIFDEPFKNVSKEYRSRLAQFVRKISESLDIQLIITTHMEELAECAHRDFVLTKSGKDTLVCTSQTN